MFFLVKYLTYEISVLALNKKVFLRKKEYFVWGNIPINNFILYWLREHAENFALKFEQYHYLKSLVLLTQQCTAAN